MKISHTIVLVFGIAPIPIRADDQKPSAPEGWQHVLPKDRTYQFLFPKNPKMIGYTSRKFTVRGIRAEVLMNYCRLRDDTYFDVEGATLSGRGLSALKVDDYYEIMLEDQRQHGFTVGESKDTTIAKSKAREYRMRKDGFYCRAVLLPVKDRVFQVRMWAADEVTLQSEQAKTFFESFRILKDSPDAESKDDSAPAEERSKEAMAKFGFKWTLRTEEMTAPDKPVVGLIHGKEFRPDTIVRESSGNLRFRQGDAKTPDAEVRIIMFTSPKDKLENRTIEIKPDRKTAAMPTILLTSHDPVTRFPTTSSFDKYAMKLHFGVKGPDGMVPCTIYLCTDDEKKSFIAGRFSVAVK